MTAPAPRRNPLSLGLGQFMAAAGLLVVLLAILAAPPADAQGAAVVAPNVEIEIEDENLGVFARFTKAIIDFQRIFNAEVAHHMNAIQTGESLGASLIGIAIAFTYGVFHAFGPGHGKFVIISYFMGREVRIARGLAISAQMAIIHVIAAIVIVWLADIVVRAGFGIGLAEVPGVRAGSFLIIAGIGFYMFYQAVRVSLGYSSPIHDDGAGHGHGHGHSHGFGHSHGEAGAKEGSVLALAAGMVPCPGAVLIMLYAIANDMIYPGFVLVVAMSVGIGLTISLLGIGAILARRTAMRLVESSGGAGGVALLRTTFNYGGAIVVTAIGLVSFVAFLDVPLG